jgi:hypothetical protein
MFSVHGCHQRETHHLLEPINRRSLAPFGSILVSSYPNRHAASRGIANLDIDDRFFLVRFLLRMVLPVIGAFPVNGGALVAVVTCKRGSRLLKCWLPPARFSCTSSQHIHFHSEDDLLCVPHSPPFSVVSIGQSTPLEIYVWRSMDTEANDISATAE